MMWIFNQVTLFCIGVAKFTHTSQLYVQIIKTQSEKNKFSEHCKAFTPNHTVPQILFTSV